MSKEEIIAFLNDMIDALTWRRAGLLVLFGVFTIGLMVSFENRSSLFDSVYKQASIEHLVYPWELTDSTKSDLIGLLDHDLVAGVLVTEVNLKKNRKTSKFWAVKDPALREAATKINANLLPQPLFDADRKNNEQMIAVLNNQFTCVTSQDTSYAKIIPGIEKKVPYICRLSVPPYVGEFAGFIAVGLSREPTPSEVESLKIEITRISIELYLRDVAKRSVRSAGST